MELGYKSGKNMTEAEVKLEEGEVMQNGGGGAMVAVEAMPQLEVRMDAALLHCQTCLLPLRPPVFQCDAAGHVVCCFCRAGHGDICSRATTHLAQLDAVVATAKVPCRYRAFGCEHYVVYHGVADHQRACPCAPCSCPESGCPFLGTRTMLLDHLAVVHSRLAPAPGEGMFLAVPEELLSSEMLALHIHIDHDPACRRPQASKRSEV